jgi:hypothetical protein
MSDEYDEVQPTMIDTDQAKEILKQHFPEYLTGFCLCGMPIGTYNAWIDHAIEAFKSSTSAKGNETDERNV